LGNPSGTVNVGIGTATPNTGTKLDVSGTFKLGANGTPVTAIIDAANATATIQAGGIPVNTMGTATVTVANAALNAPVIVSPRSFPANPFVIAYARIITAGTVTIGILNSSGAALAANAQFFVDITVINP
jgi:hypothetical protein